MDNLSPRQNVSTASGTVLVVDDDQLQRGEIVDFLTRQGIEAASEDNGFAAYHHIKNTRPRVVVMDMKMPGLDGLHVARLVGKLENPPQVILMSGYPDYIFRAHAEDTDIFAVIEKPVPLAVLERFINEAFNQPVS